VLRLMEDTLDGEQLEEARAKARARVEGGGEGGRSAGRNVGRAVVLARVSLQPMPPLELRLLKETKSAGAAPGVGPPSSGAGAGAGADTTAAEVAKLDAELRSEAALEVYK